VILACPQFASFQPERHAMTLTTKMISTLDTKLHKIVCIDEIDETVSTTKWTKKAQKQVDMLNKDSNMTAGLEAELTVGINARVMLRRNVDTKCGLVNGEIGTVTAISANENMDKFDHIHEPYPIQMVKGKFLLMKAFMYFINNFLSPFIISTIHLYNKTTSKIKLHYKSNVKSAQ